MTGPLEVTCEWGGQWDSSDVSGYQCTSKCSSFRQMSCVLTLLSRSLETACGGLPASAPHTSFDQVARETEADGVTLVDPFPFGEITAFSCKDGGRFITDYNRCVIIEQLVYSRRSPCCPLFPFSYNREIKCEEDTSNPSGYTYTVVDNTDATECKLGQHLNKPVILLVSLLFVRTVRVNAL